MKVAILFGSRSSEYLVSLSSTYSLMSHFPTNEFDPILIGISHDNKWYTGNYTLDELENDTWQSSPSSREIILKPDTDTQFMYLDTHETFGVDVCFNMIHGKYGEDGVLQAFLESAHLPYTGCDQQSSILCYDKELTHRLLDLHNIKKAKYRCITAPLTLEQYSELTQELGHKVIIKPAREGSSYGISVAETFEEFDHGLKNALSFDKKVVVEQFIEGFEIGCAVLETKEGIIVGEIDEIELHTSFFDYEAKYAFKDARIVCPARISETQSEITTKTALQVFDLLGCRDFARIDFFIQKSDGQVYFNEINTIPGFTSHSRFPSMMKEIGVSYQTIISTLIHNALNRHE